jgi:DNA invertase Pin-like site-specific DNA recombinase
VSQKRVFDETRMLRQIARNSAELSAEFVSLLVAKSSSHYHLVGEEILRQEAGMLIGYCRISTKDQSLDLQRDALRAAGCELLFEDSGISGAKMARPGLDKALSHLRKDDVLVVWRLDRLGRTILGVIELVNGLRERGIQFRSLTEGFDTTTASGRLLFHIIGALAEMEREIIRERTHAGLAAARARGRNGGRKRKVDTLRMLGAKAMLDGGKVSAAEVAAELKISRATLYRSLARARAAA